MIDNGATTNPTIEHNIDGDKTTNYGGNQTSDLTDGKILGIIIGCSVGLFVLVVILIIICIFRRRYRRSLDLSNGDKENLCESKSAPISRNISPKLPKRKSLPDVKDFYQRLMVRSLAQDKVPDFSLPPERVQPPSADEQHRSSTAYQYQQSFLGNLQPDLYRFYGATADDDVLLLPPSDHGRLWFYVTYDGAVEHLNVTLVKVKELPGRDRANAPRDPFVKLYLLPDERISHTSKVRKKTLAPIYNETFVFNVSPNIVREKVLRFSVYDVDKRRIRHSLGHVLVPLKDIDLTKGDIIWRDLEHHSQVSSSLGELSLSLCYIPGLDKVKIVVLQARDLHEINIDRDNGIYVRIQMTHGRKIYKVKKTIVQEMSTDPVFNESFSFPIAGKILDTCSFNFTVMTSPKSALGLGNDEVYGKVIIGSFMYSRGEELLHWQDMLSQTRTPVTKWHALTPEN